MTSEQKLDKIIDVQQGQNEKIAVMSEQLKTLLEHDKRIEDLEKNQNRAVGALVIVGGIFSGFVAWLFKKIE